MENRRNKTEHRPFTQNWMISVLNCLQSSISMKDGHKDENVQTDSHRVHARLRTRGINESIHIFPVAKRR